MTSTPDWNEIRTALAAGRELTDAQVRAVIEEMMQGRCDDTDAADFLMAMRAKGETAAELAAAARVLREHMLAWEPGCDVLDTCGTGGDGAGTFNISTAAAFVVAGAGVKVVKHGNRSVSSRSGSADVMAALGVPVDGDAASARRSLDRAGLAFCFAPRFHPALRYIAPVRKRLGVATLFNCLGPLANPAGAQRQLLGVGRIELLDLMAGALAQLQTTRALVVFSQDGLDEVSLAATTFVREVRGRDIRSFAWQPADFDLAPVAMKDLAAVDARASALLIEGILGGTESPASRVVLANAAAALIAVDRVSTPAAGVELARQAVRSGRALAVLQALRETVRG